MNVRKWCFADAAGNMVYGQFPNLPIIVWAGARVLLLIEWLPNVQAALELLAFGCLFTWAWMELFVGVNPFRRFLGMLVLTFLLFGPYRIT